MDKCGTWRSSYRLVLAVRTELPTEPRFNDEDLNPDGDDIEIVRSEALWDVMIVQHASEEGVFFPTGSDARSDEGEDEMDEL